MRQKLDIADVERRTKIRAKYLRALENEEWGTLPGPTFVKTFLRTYADLVGVDAHLLVEEYRTNHEPGDEFDPPTRPGRPAATRRPPRRRPRAPGPPSKLGAAVGLVVALLCFLLVLGIVSGDDEEPATDRAGQDTGTQTQPRTTPRPRPKPAPAPPTGITVRLAPAAPTYACIDTGAGTGVVFEGILEGPRTFKNPNRLRLNLGKRAIDMRVNGKPVRIAPSPEPVGFDLTRGRVTEIPEGTRPCA